MDIVFLYNNTVNGSSDLRLVALTEKHLFTLTHLDIVISTYCCYIKSN